MEVIHPHGGKAPPGWRIAALAARQHGVVATEQLLAAEITDRMIEGMVARGHLHRIHRGVYAVGHPRLTRHGREMAAVLACGPGAALSHRWAGAIWGILPRGTVPRDSDRIDVLCATDRRRPGITCHQSASCSAADVTARDGVPVTTVARTIVDLARTENRQRLELILHEAQIRRLLKPQAIHRALARTSDRRGAASLTRLLDDAVPRTRTELERRFLKALHRVGIPKPKTNEEMEIGGHRYEPDAVWPEQRLVVELDGFETHQTRHAFEADRARDARLTAAGFTCVRFTWRAVTAEPQSVAQQIARILSRQTYVITYGHMEPRDWDGATYDRISGPIERVGLETLARLNLDGNETVLDAGCGSGRVTEALVERLPRGHVIAVDGSAGMLAAARERLGDRAELIHADLLELDLNGRTVDAVLSTATFHWIEDHAALFAKIHAVLRPGGQFVAQCGGTGNTIELVKAAQTVARRQPFAEHMSGWAGPWNFAGPPETTDRLERAGFTDVRAWLVQRPPPYDELRPWLENNGLGSHLERLPDRLRDPYVDAIVEELDSDAQITYIRLNFDAVAGR